MQWHPNKKIYMTIEFQNSNVRFSFLCRINGHQNCLNKSLLQNQLELNCDTIHTDTYIHFKSVALYLKDAL